MSNLVFPSHLVKDDNRAEGLVLVRERFNVAKQVRRVMIIGWGLGGALRNILKVQHLLNPILSIRGSPEVVLGTGHYYPRQAEERPTLHRPSR